jgi:hypothetical protein
MAFPAILAAILPALIGGAASMAAADKNAKGPGQSPLPAAGGAPNPSAQSVFGTGLPGLVDQQPVQPTIGQYIDPGLAAVMAQGPPKPEAAKVPEPQKGTSNPGVGDVLAQVPEALAMVAPLLAMAQNQPRKTLTPVGAQGGGHSGQMVQGFNLPQRRTIGELLTSLPRPRYG